MFGPTPFCAAKWDGAAWSSLGVGSPVTSLAVLGTDLYAGGFLPTVLKWNGDGWSSVGPLLDGPVFALAVLGTNLYAGGYFTTVGGVTVNRIMKWDGQAWSALGLGAGGCVKALAVSGTSLYAGGDFTTAGGVSANNIAKWDGTTWSALGSGVDSVVTALAASGTDLYAGGSFTWAGGESANYVAKWNGSAWSALGSGMDSVVSALAASGTNLYAGGSFTWAGGVLANHIAQWNGSAWWALGSGMNNNVNALTVFGADLYAGGQFTTAGGKVSAFAARALLSASPVVVTTVGPLSYTENDGPVRIDSGLTVADEDSARLFGATVSITSGFQTAEDVLAFTNQNGITGDFSSAIGVLTLSGSASVADYQAALRSVTYQNTGANPNTMSRVVTFVVNDGTLTGNNTRTIAITAVNEAPQVTTTSGALNCTANDGLVCIDSGLTVTDMDSTNLVGATVSITRGFQTFEDVLAFTNQNGITGSFSSATGVLTLSGSASVADYQAALRSVTYQNATANPNTMLRVVTFMVNDGTLTGNNMRIIAVIDARTLSNGAAIVINDASDATPYPSTITVSGVSGKVSKLQVLLRGVTHTWPDDLDILLVGPGGQEAILMSDAGGGYGINGVDLTFDDSATSALPDSAQIVAGAYKPTDYETGDAFGGPAPVEPYTASLAGFLDTNPNGAWSLYVRDDEGGNIGTIATGWTLTLTLSHPVVTTTNDAGPGSLRAIMESIDAGERITFDPAVFPPGAPATVLLTNALPALIHGSVTIDASSAGVILDGSRVGTTWERVLIDDVSLSLDGGTNVLVNGDFSAGMNHWSTQDSSSLDGHSRSLETDDYNSGPASYAISGQALLTGEVTFYDTLDRATASTNDLWSAGSSGWIPAAPGQVATLDLWYKSQGPEALVYLLALRADGAADIVFGLSLPGGMTEWGNHTATQALPPTSVGVALVFYTMHSQTTTTGLVINSQSNTVQGLQIINFTGPGLRVNSASNNTIGGRRNQGTGPLGQGNLVGANGRGIEFYGSSSNVLKGNIIGANIAGLKAMGNRGAGVYMENSRGNVIGGNTADERNLVSGNAGPGISLSNSDTNLIEGNFIGTDVTGLNALGNGSNGIELYESRGAVIGGDTPEERNIISGNEGMGIQLYSNSDANRIKGNFIGTDLNGWQSLGNGGEGIYLHESRSNVVGGNTPEERNLVSGNAGAGISLNWNSDTNIITGNFIGTVVAGYKPLGNLGGGICLYDSGYNTLGGYASGEGNVKAATE